MYGEAARDTLTRPPPTARTLSYSRMPLDRSSRELDRSPQSALRHSIDRHFDTAPDHTPPIHTLAHRHRSEGGAVQTTTLVIVAAGAETARNASSGCMRIPPPSAGSESPRLTPVRAAHNRWHTCRPEGARVAARSRRRLPYLSEPALHPPRRRGAREREGALQALSRRCPP